MPKRSRAAGARPHTYRRREQGVGPAPAGTAPSASGASAAPRLPAPVQATPAAPETSTKITTTDYGYVIGELRRIAILTALILALLLVLWALLG